MRELRIFGPPGSGKTTKLATEEIPNAAKAFGPEKVLIASYSRTAAKEIASKKSRITGEAISIPKENVGTLHSLCYRALGSPVVAESKKKEWNDDFGAQYPMGTGGSISIDDGFDEPAYGSEGDELLSRVNIYRARLVDRKLWPAKVQHFYNKWEAFKTAHGYIDFADMIDLACQRVIYPPGNPDVMFFDEAQDFTPLQLKLVRSWGNFVKWFVMVGDDDQTIYRFSGASPEAFLQPALESKYIRVLDQSWRVPQTVLDKSMAMISRVKNRQIKEYRPRADQDGLPVAGSVVRHSGNYKQPERFVNEIIDKSKDRTVMIIASCSYMIDPIKHLLKSKGVPFCNHYRKKRADWNPLLSGGDEKVNAVDLVNAFLSNGPDGYYWTVEEFLKWAKFIRVSDNGLQRKKGNAGLKFLSDAVDAQAEGLESVRNILAKILSQDAIEPALGRNISWLMDNVQPKRREGLEYPIKVFQNMGSEVLNKKPNITLGTIHSVKGGEASSVYLMPDISIKAVKENRTDREAIDAMHRLFYVGMTRAYDELVLMSRGSKPSIGGKLYVEW